MKTGIVLKSKAGSREPAFDVVIILTMVKRQML
jgi:hypothetical protein